MSSPRYQTFPTSSCALLGVSCATSPLERSAATSTGAASVDELVTVDGISRAIDVYYRTSKPYNSKDGFHDGPGTQSVFHGHAIVFFEQPESGIIYMRTH